MNEQLKYQILVILKYNRNVWELIDKGYEFGQVTILLTSFAIWNIFQTIKQEKCI